VTVLFELRKLTIAHFTENSAVALMIISAIVQDENRGNDHD
jgi:hypothetical protein